MKQLRYFSIYALLCTLACLSNWHCRKEEEGFRTYVNTLLLLEEVVKEAPDPSLHTTFVLSDLISDTVLTTPAGIQIQLTDTEHLFADLSDTPAPCSTCDELTVELLEVRKQGDMLANRLQTVGNDNSVLESLAAVQVRVSCDGKALKLLADRNLLLRVPEPGANLNADFRTLLPDSSNIATPVSWQMPGAPAYFAEWPVNNGIQKGYELVLEQLGWVSCARKLDTPSSTSFCVSLEAPPYNRQNTLIYMVLENTNSVIELSAEEGTERFCCNHAPWGFPVQVVSLSNTEKGFELGNFITEIGTNSETPLAPLVVDEDTIIDFLRNL